MITIVPYEKEDIGEVIEFNKRLREGGVVSQFSELNVPAWLPPIEGRTLFVEYFLAKDSGTVRACYLLKHQLFHIRGEVQRVAHYSAPISEGRYNRKYSLLGLKILADALKRQPKLFCIGLGGYAERLPIMLKQQNWSMYSVPFFFNVIHPFAFFKNIEFLRRRRYLELVMNVMAHTGIGWLGLSILRGLRRQSKVNGTVITENFKSFESWTDELWHKCKNDYVMSAVRDAENMNALYPSDAQRFIKLLIKKNSEIIGWVVVLNTQMSGHRHFGAMRVGSIIDGFGLARDADQIILAATRYLENDGVDIIVANHSNKSWGAAFKKAGFVAGPSNFIFTVSVDLGQKLEPFLENVDRTFMCRGDGDGPIHL